MIETGYNENADYFRELYSKFNQTVYKYILVSIDFNESLTDDCLQDVYATVYSKMDEIKKHPNPGGFLIVTARNFIKKYKSNIRNQIKHMVELDTSIEDKVIYEKKLVYERKLILRFKLYCTIFLQSRRNGRICNGI